MLRQQRLMATTIEGYFMETTIEHHNFIQQISDTIFSSRGIHT